MPPRQRSGWSPSAELGHRSSGGSCLARRRTSESPSSFRRLRALGFGACWFRKHEGGDPTRCPTNRRECPSSYRKLIKLLNFRLGHRFIVPIGMCAPEVCACVIPPLRGIVARVSRQAEHGTRFPDDHLVGLRAPFPPNGRPSRPDHGSRLYRHSHRMRTKSPVSGGNRVAITPSPFLAALLSP